MRGLFFIVGPTACGKSELAADVAERLGAEIVSADAFQIYRGFDLLTAKPAAATLAKTPHHLVSAIDATEEMNAAKYETLAREIIDKIHDRGRSVLIVGGTGLYVRALTHGLSPLPGANVTLRSQLSHLSTEELFSKLEGLDPVAAMTIDRRNPRRLIRAIEICIESGEPVSAQRQHVRRKEEICGVLAFRERDELYARIDQRVVQMFDAGVVDEVRAAPATGLTASQMLGLAEIRRFVVGEISRNECIARIQQATRRYAKRQLTWFRRQSNFEALNLTSLTHAKAIECVAHKARLPFVND